jgi:sugar lactone lactonase YvrE
MVLTLLFRIPASADTLPDRIRAEFDSPGALAVDRASTPNHLYVVDAGNHRVLAWEDALEFAGGGDPDLVIGQPNLTASGCNTGGRSARTLCFTNRFGEVLPGGLAMDGAGNLYVADSGNHRVLIFDAPFANDVEADEVIGQESFTVAGCNRRSGPGPNKLCAPQGIAIDREDNLYVADEDNNRVLQFNSPRTTDQSADRIFGQRGRFRTGVCEGSVQNGICRPEDVAVDEDGNLYVAVAGHNRVLIFLDPTDTDTSADAVLGQGGSFTSRRCSRLRNTGLCAPHVLELDEEGNLYIGENTRIIRYTRPLSRPTVDLVIRLRGVSGLAADADGNLYASDRENDRVLEFDQP